LKNSRARRTRRGDDLQRQVGAHGGEAGPGGSSSRTGSTGQPTGQLSRAHHGHCEVQGHRGASTILRHSQDSADCRSLNTKRLETEDFRDVTLVLTARCRSRWEAGRWGCQGRTWNRQLGSGRLTAGPVRGVVADETEAAVAPAMITDRRRCGWRVSYLDTPLLNPVEIG